LNQPEISIVIPTFNRRDVLQEALGSLCRQRDVDFECVVVDNGPSTDGTAEGFAATVGGDARFRLVQTGPTGIFPAVNRGFAETNGRLVLVMDDDVELVDPGTLSHVLAQFQKWPNAGVIGLSEFYPGGRHAGHQAPERPAGKVTSLRDTRLYEPGMINRWGMIGTKFHQLPFGDTVALHHVRSSAMAVRRNVFDTVGGFSDAYSATGRGYRCETHFCLEVRRAGFDVMFSAQDPQVLHKQAPRMAGYGRDGLDREYLVGTGSNNTFFFLSNFWTRRSAPLFIAWDMLVGNTSQPGVLRLLKSGVYRPSTYWHAINGKWLGARLFWRHGPVAAR
jgi:GT2 family glycosyltransferase